MTNLEAFIRTVEFATTTDVEERFLRRFKEAAKAGAIQLIRGTPVRSGTARGNYVFSTGTPSEAFDPSKQDLSGFATIQEIIREIEAINDPGVQIWISNNARYIGFLENGISDQAPEGMLKFARERVLAVLRERVVAPQSVSEVA